MNPMFYFLLALTAVLAVTTTTADGKPVLDVYGEIMYGDISYYIVPVNDQGGGVSVASHGAKLCPFDVVQVPYHDDMGISVEFSNWRSEGEFVPLLESLNIKMNVDSTICDETYWSFKFLTGVTVGPKSFFRIQSVGTYYKFVVCTYGCRDIGIKVEKNGNRHLAFSNTPFLVMFKKAYVPAGSS